MIKAVFLDMDDTLVVNAVLYRNAELQFYGYLRNFGILRAEAEEAFNQADKENFKTHGYSKTRMPASFEATLKRFVPDADAEMVKVARSFADEIFTARVALKPGVTEAIALLSQHYPLYILTAGDEDVQQNRYDNNIPFKDKIAGVMIVPKKNEDVYKDTLNKLGLAPEEAVMIGDSLRSDIVPAVAAGMGAVWIEADNWALENIPQGLPKGAYKAASLLEAARHIIRCGTTAALARKPPAPKSKTPKRKLPKPPKAI